MLRRWMLGGVGGMLLASLVGARQGVVKTLDGQSFQGDISEQQDQLVVERTGIHTVVPRENVLSISYSDSIEEAYRQKHRRLAPYDVPGRLELAHWLFDNKSYDLALDVLEEARAIQPHNDDVARMMQTVDRQMQLDGKQQRLKLAQSRPVEVAAADNAPRTAGMAPATQRRPQQPANGRDLTPEEVNSVRQSEWQEGQRVSGIRFEDDVRRKYVAREGLSSADFLRLPAIQQAWAIIQRGTPEMKKDVIIGDPPALLQYRTVQHAILTGCAATGCHTPDRAPGGFALHLPAQTDADTVTNFVILQQYSANVEKRKYQMIDRESPDRSLLVQFALPPDIADAPHPKAGNYRGIVRARNDPRLQAAIEWMGRTLKPVAPDYDFDLTPGSPTTRPSAPQKNPRPAVR